MSNNNPHVLLRHKTAKKPLRNGQEDELQDSNEQAISNLKIPGFPTFESPLKSAHNLNLEKITSFDMLAGNLDRYPAVDRDSGTQQKYTIFEFLDPEAPEVIMARPSSFSHYMPLPNSHDYEDIRTFFRIQRHAHLMKLSKLSSTEQLLFSLFNNQPIYVMLQYKTLMLKVFERYEWVLVIVSLFLEFLFCVVYLQEMELNSINPCQNNTCSDFGSIPAYLLVNRSPGSFLVLRVGSILKIILAFLKMVITSSFLKFALSPTFILDILMGLAFILLAYLNEGRFVYIPYYLQCFLVLISLKTILASRGHHAPSNVDRIIMLIANILVLLYFGACTFSYFETQFYWLVKSTSSSVITSFYFMVITMTTVGYGDISPQTVPGQITIVILIGVAIVIIPILISDLQDTINSNKNGEGSYTKDRHPFVVIFGRFAKDPERILDIIQTIFNKDNQGAHRTKVVLYAKNVPSVALQNRLKARKFRGRVEFIAGNGIDSTDFKRLNLRKAAGAIILADTNSSTAQMDDEHNTLRAWAFYLYAPDLPIYLETLFSSTALLQADFATGTICIRELEGIFLAYNCLYRGSGCLMLNLLRPTKAPSELSEQWNHQFLDSSKNAIYLVKANVCFHSYSFQDVSLYLFQQFQILLFGLQIAIPGSVKLLSVLNPVNYSIRNGDELIVIANSFEDIKGLLSLTNYEFQASKTNHARVRANSAKVEFCTTKIHSAADVLGTGSPISSNFPSFNECVNGYPGATSRVPKCILRAAPIEMSTMILDSSAQLKHFILMVTDQYEILKFLITLRHSSLSSSEFRQILIMSPYQPTVEEYSKISQFPEVYFIIGDLRKLSDLKRAGIVEAQRIVIMPLRNSGISAEADEDLQDSPTILVSNMISKYLKSISTKVHTITMLRKTTNIQFLLDSKPVQKNQQFSPLYASGSVLSTVLLESLLSSCINQPFLLSIMHKLSNIRFEMDFALEDKFDIKPTSLTLLSLPLDMVGSSFGDFFAILNGQGIITLGLLREGNESGNSSPFVYTNPPHSLILFQTDLIYAIVHPSQVQ